MITIGSHRTRCQVFIVYHFFKLFLGCSYLLNWSNSVWTRFEFSIFVAWGFMLKVCKSNLIFGVMICMQYFYVWDFIVCFKIGSQSSNLVTYNKAYNEKCFLLTHHPSYMVCSTLIGVGQWKHVQISDTFDSSLFRRLFSGLVLPHPKCPKFCRYIKSRQHTAYSSTKYLTSTSPLMCLSVIGQRE